MTLKQAEHVQTGAADPDERPAALDGAIFGPAPLLPGERPQDYVAMGERLRQAIRPVDFVEEIWLRDLQDYSWERWRWRRLKTQFLALGAQEGLELVLLRLQVDDAADLARDWALGDPDSKTTVRSILDAAGLSMEAVHGLALAHRLNVMEQMSRMEERLEQRFASLLRALDGRRHQRRQVLLRIAEGARSGHQEERAPTGTLAYADG